MPRRSIRRAFDMLTAAGFVTAIAVPGVWMTLGPEEPPASFYAAPLAPKPAPPEDFAAAASYPQAFDAYLGDHFGLRPALRQVHAAAWFRLLGMSPHPVVATGRNGTLFGSADLESLGRESPMTDKQLADAAEVLQERYDWLARRGIKYLVVLTPNKSSVCPQLVPASVPGLSRERPAGQLARYLAARTTVPVLDLAPALLAAGGGPRRTFPRLDVHWGDYGGYVGYRAVVGRLAEWFPGMTPIPEDRCVIEDLEVTGDLACIMGFPELREIRTYMRPAAARASGLEGWGGAAHGAALSATSVVPDPGLPRAVVFHDSFMTAQKQFLAEHFQAVRFRWVYSAFDAAAVAEVEPHVVIQEMFEGVLPRGLAANPPELTHRPDESSPARLPGASADTPPGPPPPAPPAKP